MRVLGILRSYAVLHLVTSLALPSDVPPPSPESDSDTCDLIALVRDYELGLSLLVSPPPHWGARMRREQTLHILTLGGSNSDRSDRWPYVLETALKTAFSGVNASVINKAESGMGIGYTVGDTYPFEHLPAAEWPSLVILESAVNCDIDVGCLIAHEQIKKYLDHKWVKNGLDPPDLLIVELIRIDSLRLKLTGNNTYTDRLKQVREFDKSELRNRIVSDFARFYRIPMISLVDVLVPSLFRHFLACSTEINWNYMDYKDLVHIHPSTHVLLVNEILVPFLKKHFLNSANDTLSPRTFIDYRVSYLKPRYYRDAVRDATVQKWTSWGFGKSLRNIVLYSPHWSFMNLKGHDEGGHVCFGTITKGSVGKFRVRAPPSCQQNSPCLLHMHYIHSWNRSYVSDASCAVYEDSNSSPVETTFINGSVYEGELVRDTVPRKIRLASLTNGGSYFISCFSTENKFACISSIELQHEGDIEQL